MLHLQPKYEIFWAQRQSQRRNTFMAHLLQETFMKFVFYNYFLKTFITEMCRRRSLQFAKDEWSLSIGIKVFTETSSNCFLINNSLFKFQNFGECVKSWIRVIEIVCESVRHIVWILILFALVKMQWILWKNQRFCEVNIRSEVNGHQSLSLLVNGTAATCEIPKYSFLFCYYWRSRNSDL